MTAPQLHSVVHEANGIIARPTPKTFFERQPSKSLSSKEEYDLMYKQSIEDPESFFDPMAKQFLTWDKDFTKVKSGSLENGDSSWFLGGKLNACYNCVDRHAFQNPNKIALIFEADDENESRKITFGELLREVSQVAGVLKSWGIQKGDTVAIYLPMTPEAIIAMLACARLGAVHSVIFAGFSAGSIKERVNDAESKVLITVDEGKRGGKTINNKKIVDEALKDCPTIEKVLVHKRTGNNSIYMQKDRDFYWQDIACEFRGYIPPVSVDSEDPLFMLYTSGSTGAPKGVVHSTGGYLLGAAMTTRYVFDLQSDDVLFTAGDVGWITGHSYALYGPLTLGVTSIIFEGTPAYPNFGRFWRIIEKNKATHFYVAPTALRMLKKSGEDEISKYDLSSLRTLGSVGEPIASEIWQWYDEKIGHGCCHISDTYWQTESGSHLIAPLAGAVPTKPGAATVPFFGIDAVIIDPTTGKVLEGNDVEGVLAVKSSWPSMARTVYKNNKRYLETYLKPYPGYYFTGDGAGRDHDGYYWIRGRVDDVVNVSGHRLSTAEIEAVLLEDSARVSEAAVVGINDDITGQAVIAFVQLKNSSIISDDASLLKLRQDLRLSIRATIGPFAAPKTIIIVDDLPKTRSGKIVRRVLRKIVSGEAGSLGDQSTLADPECIPPIIDAVEKQFGVKN
ncbi:acetyl-coenzyme A synthetase 2 [Pichia californica]|uniref:Acetyl-coenzyme A synthetase n=1 Tax=Pichia californica TaxID=460514 RepID=A0A9P6WGR4_9ASCO|nr:acetyl-coenzyme A synthetase 2 [[Candida] californica]KAG0686880.1 acetyl-coenzyme A synthetase 2 [[Candida] californica]